MLRADRAGRVVTRLAAAGAVTALGLCTASAADVASKARAAAPAQAVTVEDDGFEVESAFGFTEGAQLTQEGEIEVGTSIEGRFGKRRGTYRAFASETEIEYGINDRIAAGFAAFTAGHRIRGVPLLDKRSSFGFDGFAAETKVMILDRGIDGPIGLSVVGELEWHRFDETEGTPGRYLGAGLKGIAEAAIVPNLLYVAGNLGFEVEHGKGRGEPAEKESSLFASAALSYRFTPRALVGAEARVENAYEGIFGDRVGTAVFLGPTAFWKVSSKVTLSAAWSAQVWGDGHGGLNLRDFDRHRATMRMSVEF